MGYTYFCRVLILTHSIKLYKLQKKYNHTQVHCNHVCDFNKFSVKTGFRFTFQLIWILKNVCLHSFLQELQKGWKKCFWIFISFLFVTTSLFYHRTKASDNSSSILKRSYYLQVFIIYCLKYLSYYLVRDRP